MMLMLMAMSNPESESHRPAESSRSLLYIGMSQRTLKVAQVLYADDDHGSMMTTRLQCREVRPTYK